jgi:hypothetical protein
VDWGMGRMMKRRACICRAMVRGIRKMGALWALGRDYHDTASYRKIPGTNDD